MQRIANIAAPFEFRPIDPYFSDPAPGAPPLRRVWMRTVDRLPDDPDVHRAILAYVSDYGLITTLLMPQRVRLNDLASTSRSQFCATRVSADTRRINGAR